MTSPTWSQVKLNGYPPSGQFGTPVGQHSAAVVQPFLQWPGAPPSAPPAPELLLDPAPLIPPVLLLAVDALLLLDPPDPELLLLDPLLVLLDPVLVDPLLLELLPFSVPLVLDEVPPPPSPPVPAVDEVLPHPHPAHPLPVPASAPSAAATTRTSTRRPRMSPPFTQVPGSMISP